MVKKMVNESKTQNINRLIWGNLGQGLVDRDKERTLALLQGDSSKELFTIGLINRRRIKKKLREASTPEKKREALEELKAELREENYYREVKELMNDKSEIVEGSLIMGDIPITLAELLEDE